MTNDIATKVRLGKVDVNRRWRLGTCGKISVSPDADIVEEAVRNQMFSSSALTSPTFSQSR